MSRGDKVLRQVSGQGHLTLPKECREVLGDVDKVGVDATGNEITLYPDPEMGNVDRALCQGKVTIPIHARNRWGEDRFFSVEPDEGEGVVRVVPQVVMDVDEAMVEDVR